MAQEQKSRLIESLKAAHEAMETVVARIDPAQEVYASWTIKQVLAHIAGWDEAVNASLKAYLEGDESVIPAYSTLR